MAEDPLRESFDGSRSIEADDLVVGIVEAAPDGIVVVDGTGTIVLANRQTETLFGWARGELLGQPVEVLLPERQRQVHVTHCIRYRGDPRTRAMGAGLDLVGRRHDGTEFPVEISLSPFRRGDKVRTIAVVRDITERRRAEQQLRETQESLRLLEDRERIARDLHDLVIQRLFASGMALQGVISRVEDRDIASRVTAVVDDLDDTIRQLRTVIFALQTREHERIGLRARVLAVTTEQRSALGFEPRVSFDGPIDVVDEAVAEQLLPTLREALANVARHAAASETRVSLTARAGVLTLRVVDDGDGGADPGTADGSGNGIRNATARAGSLGGTCTFTDRSDGGAVLEWQVPIPE
jgi:PAS domain S-box-containing protein